MNKKLYVVLSIVLLATMILTACQAPATQAPAKKFKACQITDTGGVDDKSFNATAWKGMQDAKTAYAIDIKYLESKQQTDYEKNMNAFIEEKCDIIVPVGFLLGDATKAAAEKNKDMKFAIVDFGYSPEIPNVLGSGFVINDATYLAGYLAASQTKTGKVGVYGGLQIPPVTIFMDGFYLGVQKYNEVKGKKVEVKGWDPKTQKGLFTGDFSNLDNGKKLTETLLDEGADIIMPVAGPVGQGTLAALKARKTGLMIGVDTDWSLLYPDYKEFILASALKNMDMWVKDTIKAAIDGKFKGGSYTGTLANNGVGLAIGSEFKTKLDAALTKEIDTLKADLIAGKLKSLP
jgi:basic membrane protein A